MPTPQRYDQRTIVFHWLTAATIAVMWLIPQVIDQFTGATRIYVRSVHILLGVALLALVVARLVWRATGGRRLPPAETGLKGTAATLAHVALYALTLTVLIAGVTYVFARGDNILNLGRLPAFAADDHALRRLIGSVHSLAANGVLILAGLHAAAALAHHYVLKDGVLRRMLPQT
jgi:cytochrome b561